MAPLEDLRRLLAVYEGKGFDARRDTALIRALLDNGARLAGEVAASAHHADILLTARRAAAESGRTGGIAAR